MARLAEQGTILLSRNDNNDSRIETRLLKNQTSVNSRPRDAWQHSGKQTPKPSAADARLFFRKMTRPRIHTG